MVDLDDRLIKLLYEFRDDLAGLGIQAVFLDIAPDRPIPSLTVRAPPDKQGNERSVLLAFIPTDGEVEEVDLLQLYMPLPVPLSEEALAARLPQVNASAVLGHGGITSTGEAYWRHIWPLPRGLPIVASVLFEVIQFFVFAAELGLDAIREKQD